jgi:hypothetical protein
MRPEDRLRWTPARAFATSRTTTRSPGHGHASQTPTAEHGHALARRRGQFRGLTSLSGIAWVHSMTGTHARPVCQFAGQVVLLIRRSGRARYPSPAPITVTRFPPPNSRHFSTKPSRQRLEGFPPRDRGTSRPHRLVKKLLYGGHYLCEHACRRRQLTWHEHPVIRRGDLDHIRRDRPGNRPIPGPVSGTAHQQARRGSAAQRQPRSAGRSARE